MKLTADEFNAKFPVGTTVTYYPVLPEMDGVLPVITKTRTPAWQLGSDGGDGEAVVCVEGRPGGRALTHIELREAGPPVDTTGPEDLMATLDRITAAREEDESIRCPYCGEKQNLDFCDGDGHLVTHWGEDTHETFCQNCDEPFRVRENVSRTYDTAKVGEEFE